MYIAQNKRRENIAEYVLYLWQLEDLLRALQFSPEAIYSTLVKPRALDLKAEEELLEWYVDIAKLLEKEGKEEHGHLEHTLHLIADLHNLHLQLLALPIGKRYRELYAAAGPALDAFRVTLGDKADMSDTELSMRALYAVVLYRLKGEGQSRGEFIEAVTGIVSPMVAELADVFRRAETGELDLFRSDENN